MYQLLYVCFFAFCRARRKRRNGRYSRNLPFSFYDVGLFCFLDDRNLILSLYKKLTIKQNCRNCKKIYFEKIFVAFLSVLSFFCSFGGLVDGTMLVRFPFIAFKGFRMVVSYVVALKVCLDYECVTSIKGFSFAISAVAISAYYPIFCYEYSKVRLLFFSEI